jgi:hypothetical protein
MEAQADLEKLIDASEVLSRATRRFVHANGAESIETTSRCKVQFRTRTKTGGKGLSANKVILDEAFAAQPNQMGALIPTLTAMPDPQLFYGSSAAMEDSYILHEKIKDGRPGDERDWMTSQPLHRMVEAGGAAYLEWCAPPPEITCDAGIACTHAKTAAGWGTRRSRCPARNTGSTPPAVRGRRCGTSIRKGATWTPLSTPGSGWGGTRRSARGSPRSR